jgi:Ca2+-binding EF-hand superfamily protein
MAAAVRMKSVSFEDDVRKAFELFDKNGDGMLTVKELKKVLASLKISLSDIELVTL